MLWASSTSPPSRPWAASEPRGEGGRRYTSSRFHQDCGLWQRRQGHFRVQGTEDSTDRDREYHTVRTPRNLALRWHPEGSLWALFIQHPGTDNSVPWRAASSSGWNEPGPFLALGALTSTRASNRTEGCL